MKIEAKTKVLLYDLTDTFMDRGDLLGKVQRDLMIGMVEEMGKGSLIEIQAKENHMEGVAEYTAIAHVYSANQFNKMCQAVSQLWFAAPEYRGLLSLFLGVLGADQPGKVEIKTEP